MFTNEELDYLKELVMMSRESLDECCDTSGHVVVDFINQTDANQEYALIYGILTKLERYNHAV